MEVSPYVLLVYLHLLLFVLWLGMDAAVFVLSRHFLKRTYSLDQRMALLKMLVIIDMGPRTAWALMVPVSLLLLKVAGWWDVPIPLLVAGFLLAGIWLWLVWDAHSHDGTPRAAQDRVAEFVLKSLMAAFYVGLGLHSLVYDGPLGEAWLAWKALLFGVIFAAAIMIDIAFRPLPGQLQSLLAQGSNARTEEPIRQTLFKTSVWVWSVYALLLATSFLGSVKPQVPAL